MKRIRKFLAEIQECYGSGNASEHSYRPMLQHLIAGLSDTIQVINEPKRIDCGAPDFSISRANIDIGHIEAKDLHVNIETLKGANNEQLHRYRKALPNLIYTNCLDWHFYRQGKKVASVSIGGLTDKIKPKPGQFKRLECLLNEFLTTGPKTITTPENLAKAMADKSYLVKHIFENSLIQDKNRDDDDSLWPQYLAFKKNLMLDISIEDFAEIYAETIAYGMFAARLNDDGHGDFNRTKAAELLPKTNPFLRHLFSYIAGPALDVRIAWIINILADLMQNCDIAKIVAGFGNLKGKKDPFLHFYETFLATYNPKKRKARGVWYTPESVVGFIVRSVDEILMSEFGLVEGLADNSKVSLPSKDCEEDQTQERIIRKKQVHRVQILDPAAGTGTFLAEVVKQIVPKVKKATPKMWGEYINHNLIPRLHGFEILMAPYSMCHLKLEMILKDLGYTSNDEIERMSIFLTNSLEKEIPGREKLPFTQWLSKEAEGANAIKRDTPIMCIVGNPPYLGAAEAPKGWMAKLMEDYKKEPGGKKRLNESNTKWLNDLYVQFIRMSSHLIEKNGEGVLGFITNHSWLDNPTYRGMRWHMMQVFDKIYILDLHGNAKRQERAPGGKADKNVFDIKMGVAIMIAIKNRDSKGGGQKYTMVMFGGRVKRNMTDLKIVQSIPRRLKKLKRASLYFYLSSAIIGYILNMKKDFACQNLCQAIAQGWSLAKIIW